MSEREKEGERERKIKRYIDRDRGREGEKGNIENISIKNAKINFIEILYVAQPIIDMIE